MRKLMTFFWPMMMVSMACLAQSQSLQEQLKDLEVGDHWIYNDFMVAVAKAQSEGKPLFVLFR